MIIKDIALWPLEITEILPRSKHNKILYVQQYKTPNNIVLLWYDSNFERYIRFIISKRMKILRSYFSSQRYGNDLTQRKCDINKMF